MNSLSHHYWHYTTIKKKVSQTKISNQEILLNYIEHAHYKPHDDYVLTFGVHLAANF